MRIFGGKDYYDGCNYDNSKATGVYNRKIEVIPLKNWISLHDDQIGSGDKSYDISNGLIGFCGKIYPYIRFRNGESRVNDESNIEFLYTLESFQKAIEIIRTYRAPGRYYFEGYDLLSSTGTASKRWYNQQFNDIYNPLRFGLSGNEKLLDPKDLFLKYRVPYFAIHAVERFAANKREFPYKIVLNPCLKDYMFYRVFDAYSAFQEIEMFLNNQIVNPDNPHIDPVPDHIKAESHGFNSESFRKPKSIKKSADKS